MRWELDRERGAVSQARDSPTLHTRLTKFLWSWRITKSTNSKIQCAVDAIPDRRRILKRFRVLVSYSRFIFALSPFLSFFFPHVFWRRLRCWSPSTTAQRRGFIVCDRSPSVCQRLYTRLLLFYFFEDDWQKRENMSWWWWRRRGKYARLLLTHIHDGGGGGEGVGSSPKQLFVMSSHIILYINAVLTD